MEKTSQGTETQKKVIIDLLFTLILLCENSPISLS